MAVTDDRLMRRLLCFLTLAVALVPGCDRAGLLDQDVQTPELLAPAPPAPLETWFFAAHRETQELTFARLAPNVEAEVQEASFFAVSGEERTLVVRYQGQDPSAAPLLEFQVGARSLVAYPDGLPVLPGDSIQITVTLDPQRRLIFYFQPAGLRFAPFDPARLRVNYDGADEDVNGDGTVDNLDMVLERRYRIWRQDLPGLPWEALPTLRLPFGDTVEGRITHFTGFAMAS
jgi:hypothetical protein